MTRPDSDLLVRLRGGDAAAFDEIVERYERRLIGYFFGLAGDRQAAEDCAQEVLVRIYRARETYEPDASLATFVFRVARNYWIDVYRSRRARPPERSLDQPAPGESEGETLGDRMEGAAVAPEDPLVKHEDLERLQVALQRLPEIQRSVLALAGGQNLRYEEIAGILGIPVGTVKSRVHAAVQNLRKLMGVEERSGGRELR